jgi:hypothetical protein
MRKKNWKKNWKNSYNKVKNNNLRNKKEVKNNMNKILQLYKVNNKKITIQSPTLNKTSSNPNKILNWSNSQNKKNNHNQMTITSTNHPQTKTKTKKNHKLIWGFCNGKMSKLNSTIKYFSKLLIWVMHASLITILQKIYKRGNIGPHKSYLDTRIHIIRIFGHWHVQFFSY